MLSFNNFVIGHYYEFNKLGWCSVEENGNDILIEFNKTVYIYTGNIQVMILDFCSEERYTFTSMNNLNINYKNLYIKEWNILNMDIKVRPDLKLIECIDKS